MEKLPLAISPLLLLLSCETREAREVPSTTSVNDIRADFALLLALCPQSEGVAQPGQTDEVDCRCVRWDDVNYIALREPRADGLTCVINDEGIVAGLFDPNSCETVLSTLGSTGY